MDEKDWYNKVHGLQQENVELREERDKLKAENERLNGMIKAFCRSDCDGGKEMGLCDACPLGTLIKKDK